MTQPLPADVAELLAAIADALDLPIPAVGDDHGRAYSGLIRHRTAWLHGYLGVAAKYGVSITRHTAAVREFIADTPITYTPYTPAGKDTSSADQAPAGESTQAEDGQAPAPLCGQRGGKDDALVCNKTDGHVLAGDPWCNLVPASGQAPALQPSCGVPECTRSRCRPAPQPETGPDAEPGTPGRRCRITRPHPHHLGCPGITTAEHRQAAPPPGPPAALPPGAAALAHGGLGALAWSLATASDTCGRCRRPFDPADTRWDGHARHRTTAWCRSCVDNCHGSEIADHACVICR